VVFAWFIRGMSGFRIIGRRGSGARIATAGVRKVRCTGLGVGGLWDTGFEAGAVLLLLGRLRDRLLLEEEARLPICWVKRSIYRCRWLDSTRVGAMTGAATRGDCWEDDGILDARA
jgi:hypothetical protein